jgi:hypothetical protein
VFLWARRAPGRRHPQGILAAILGLDLLLLAPAYAPTVRPAFYEEVPPVVRVLQEEAGGTDRVFVESLDRTRPSLLIPLADRHRRARFQRDTLQGYTGAAYGLHLAFNVDTEALEMLPYMRLRELQRTAPWRERLMLLGAAGVTHVITHRRLEEPQARLLGAIEGATDPAQGIYRNLLAVPRFQVVSRRIPYDGDEGFIRAVRLGPDDLFARAVLVEPDAVDPHRESDTEGARASVRLLQDGGHYLELQTSGGGGYLVISDAWNPNWRATVDGEPEPLFRANYAFRGLPVGQGEHRVRLWYSPW